MSPAVTSLIEFNAHFYTIIENNKLLSLSSTFYLLEKCMVPPADRKNRAGTSWPAFDYELLPSILLTQTGVLYKKKNVMFPVTLAVSLCYWRSAGYTVLLVLFYPCRDSSILRHIVSRHAVPLRSTLTLDMLWSGWLCSHSVRHVKQLYSVATAKKHAASGNRTLKRFALIQRVHLYVFI